MLASVCTALVGVLLPTLLFAQEPPPLRSYEEGSVPALNTRPQPPAPTGPMRLYVCGNEQRVSWRYEAQKDAFTGTNKCRPPFVVVVIPDEHLEQQRHLTYAVPSRHLKLVDGLMVIKTPEERAAIDLEWETFFAEKRRQRELLRRGQ